MPQARTSSRTPSSGHSASAAVPTSMLPGPVQIAARTSPSSSDRPVLAYQLSDNFAAGDPRSGDPMIEFIFMLTRDDVTLADAREVYASVADTGVRHVGCKDVGLPTDELA